MPEQGVGRDVWPWLCAQLGARPQLPPSSCAPLASRCLCPPRSLQPCRAGRGFCVSKTLRTCCPAKGERLCRLLRPFSLPASEGKPAAGTGPPVRAPSSPHKGGFVPSCRARAPAARAKRHPCLLSLLKQQANIASRSNFNTQQSRAKQGLGGGARCQLWQRSEPGAARSPSATACGRPSARPSVGWGGCELLPEHGGPPSCSWCFAHPRLPPWPPQRGCRSRGWCPRPHPAAPRG